MMPPHDHDHGSHGASGLASIFDVDRFMPHGHCYQWDPGILWTSVISDALIAGAYIAIPFTLVFQIMRKRKDLPFDWMFACFGLFIVACGFTHVMEIITVWKPHYPAMAIVKAITAAASVPTAIILFRLAPKIVKLPSLQQLVEEQTLRVRAEAASEAKDRFIAVLSHELRTPLTPVKAGLDILEEELRKHGSAPLTTAAQQAFAMVRNNVELETLLINDLLDLSASSGGKLDLQFTPVDMRQIVRSCVPALEDETARKRIRLDLQLDAARGFVRGSADRLQQIVKNLLSNAVKFTPEGGEITVAIAADEKELRLRVQDTGCGLDPASMQRVFQPFEQLNRKPSNAHGGLGLGLTIAKTLAEAHGGSLTADSAGAGRGATFTLTLPLADETEQTEEASPVDEAQRADDVPPAAEVSALAPKRNVLLVDDHEDTLRTIALLLRRAGYEVVTARGVEEAEPLLEGAELLISDIGLPDGDGWELMMRFKARGGEAGIAISGFGQEEDFKRSARAGFARHLVKPINIEVLRAEIRALDDVS